MTGLWWVLPALAAALTLLGMWADWTERSTTARHRQPGSVLRPAYWGWPRTRTAR